METITGKVGERRFAGLFDEPINSSKPRGCNPSSDAIGGYYSICWYENFRDSETGEIYKVYTSDGVDGGKGTYSPDDERLRSRYYSAVVQRTHYEIRNGARDVRISRNEWIIMMNHTHRFWLESAEGAHDGKQADNNIKEGLIGYCWGVPVIVDLGKTDDFDFVGILDFDEMTNEQIMVMTRWICKTAESDGEIVRRMQDEFKYPHGLERFHFSSVGHKTTMVFPGRDNKMITVVII